MRKIKPQTYGTRNRKSVRIHNTEPACIPDTDPNTNDNNEQLISKEKVEEFFAEEGALSYLKKVDVDKFLEIVGTALNFQIHNLMRTDNMQAGKYKLTPPDLFDILKIIKEPNKFTVVRKGE